MRKAIFLMALGCASAAAAQDLTPSGDPAPIRAVRLLEPDAAASARTRSFFGRVVARETAALSFEVGGQLLAIDVREGVEVEEGRIVAWLDPDPFERAVERAELALEQAERDAARAATLAERNVAADVQADDAATGRDLAEVALRDARAALEDAVLAAPFDGLVAERLAAEFTNVAPGQPILALHDLSEVRVEIEVPERVLLAAGGIDGIAFTGRTGTGAPVPLALGEFEPQAGRVGQSFRVSLILPGPSARGLIPGASMTVDALVPTRLEGAVLPASAVLGRTDRGFEVMVYSPDPDRPEEGTVAPLEVRVASPDGTTLLAADLPEGTAIVAAGAHLLRPGERVRRYDGLTPEEP